MGYAVEPEYLRITFFVGDFAGQKAGGVVPRGFGKAHAAFNGADIFVFHIDLNGFQAFGIVGAYRRKDHAIDIFRGSFYADVRIVGENERTDI